MNIATIDLKATVIAATVCVIAMVICAASGWTILSFVAAAVFSVVPIVAGLRLHAPLWRRSSGATASVDARRHVIEQTVTLAAVVLAWGAVVMFAMYLGTPLRWQHGWQYAAAMALLSALHVGYAKALRHPETRLGTATTIRRTALLAGLQGLAILAALLWLITSGKLGTVKDDWAANNVFLAGGFAIAMLSLMIARSDVILARRTGDQRV